MGRREGGARKESRREGKMGLGGEEHNRSRLDMKEVSSKLWLMEGQDVCG